MDWTLHDCKFALHDCWLKCKSQLIFFNLKNKLHTYIFFLTQPNVCHLFFWSYYFTEPLLREHIFSSRATDFCFCQWALSHDSLFLIRTNTRLRIMRAHSSTISVGAKESVSMFSRTIFYQLNNSSIQLWLHHDCYLLSKKKKNYRLQNLAGTACCSVGFRSNLYPRWIDVALQCTRFCFFFISICSFHIMQHEPPRQTYTDGILAAECQSNMCATHMDRCHFSSVLVISDN